jgi:hypothetical protein
LLDLLVVGVESLLVILALPFFLGASHTYAVLVEHTHYPSAAQSAMTPIALLLGEKFVSHLYHLLSSL